MVFPRLIPLLLVKSEGLQKSEKFGSWKYVGDVLNAVKIYNEKDVDEVVVLDVDASRQGRGPNFARLEQLAGECFMPLSYGGGITSVDEARRIMECGIEKVVINSAAWKRPELITEISSVLGSSSTVISCDVTVKRKAVLRYDHLPGKPSRDDLIESLRRLTAAGAGEVLLQSRDRDGTLAGPDISTIAAIAPSLDVPVVYGGGVASLDDAVAVWKSGVSGVAAGAWFVFRGPHRAVLITYPKYSLVKQAYGRVLGSA